MNDIYVVIKEGIYLYYLLKIVRSGFNIYCIPPHLGIHFSLHESGESHFRYEENSADDEKQPPLILVMGEAGTPIGKGIIRTPLTNLGCAVGICGALFPIDSLSEDFQRFSRWTPDCFVIETNMFPRDCTIIEIGIWAVPSRNEISFEFNNPDIPANLLYKVSSLEPQIWVFARPS